MRHLLVYRTYRNAYNIASKPPTLTTSATPSESPTGSQWKLELSGTMLLQVNDKLRQMAICPTHGCFTKD
jgi:hypothetical protein